jgi:hypothetical protein
MTESATVDHGYVFGPGAPERIGAAEADHAPTYDDDLHKPGKAR